ncbi:protein MAIN-LIKE 2-like [Hibiscus syriacus]|uniref:protein MAIN-LIKE 2-like n=1 Tax=Hibiscus syriacus TaxID=106335 RepID=UPI00192144BF|nr:protein MAIN-LIKE 2-like [Hibiscus syriacus]
MEAGFGYIARYEGPCNLESNLIYALVERWRPETHKFHLLCGKCTITLEDISLHWGLLVDGDVISGVADGDYHSLYDKYLGGIPPNFNGGQILLSWLVTYVEHLSEDCSEEHAKRVVRACILRLIGEILMLDKGR